VKSTRRALTFDEIGKLIALVAVIMGAFLYLDQPLIAGFPINDGGLFYGMIRALQGNGYRLPEYVQYNGLSIPFAYPPLGFYLGALVGDLLHLSTLAVLRWLPACILIGISLAVYRLALRLVGSGMEAGIATFLYVCIPRSMTWLIMGGGLTRGLGHLFLILFLASLYSVYTGPKRRDLVLSIVFGSLIVLSHPEAALHAVSAGLLFWLLKGRSRRSLQDSGVIALGVFVVTAAWWVPLLLRYGAGPLVSAGQTGLHTPIALIYPLFFSLSEEPMITIVAALGVIGCALLLGRRDYLLPAWLVLPFIVEPRAANTVSIVPLALLAAAALHEVILPGIAAVEQKQRGVILRSYLGSTGVKFLGGYLACFLLIVGLYAGMQLAQIRVSDANLEAFRWVAANTPAGSRFLILSGETEVFCDPVQEWFPVLAQRISETTIQGREWTSNGTFYDWDAGLQDLQRCVQSDIPMGCAQEKAQSLGMKYDFVYVTTNAITKQFCRPTGTEHRGAALLMQLHADLGYEQLYASDEVEIFARTSAATAPPTAENTKLNTISQVKDSVSRK
jgi:hypothetical protein